MTRPFRLSLPLDPVRLLGLGMTAALVIAMLIVWVTEPIPTTDFPRLFLYLCMTGSFTTATVYFLYRRNLMRHLNSLRWSLLLMIVLTVVFVFINVFVTAQLMFISDHDLVLVSALLAFSGVIAVASVYLIASLFVTQIAMLVQAAQQVAQGEFQVRLPVFGSDELTQLADTFNQMAMGLAEIEAQKRALEQTRRDLVTWLSHDLRTPLASMRVMNEAMLDGVVSDPEQVLRYRLNIQGEIEHLSQLVDDLFDLAQLDAGRLLLVRQVTSLDDLISDTLETMHARAIHAGIALSGTIERPVPAVYVAPEKIQRVLTNLLDNALHYTPAGGQIALHAARVGDALHVHVHNTGSYIPPDQRAQLFTRFYVGDDARRPTTTDYRGTGLGLAIARGFVEAHGGQLSVDSTPEAGTVFTFTLPLVPPS